MTTLHVIWFWFQFGLSGPEKLSSALKSKEEQEESSHSTQQAHSRYVSTAGMCPQQVCVHSRYVSTAGMCPLLLHILCTGKSKSYNYVCHMKSCTCIMLWELENCSIPFLKCTCCVSICFQLSEGSQQY